MAAPTVNDAGMYLASSGITSWDDSEIESALEAEKDAQARVCVVPTSGAWPAALSQALLRRVAANLARRRLPLGASASEGGILRASQLDSEVARLEAGHRRWVCA